jgi:hypothetical protein
VRRGALENKRLSVISFGTKVWIFIFSVLPLDQKEVLSRQITLIGSRPAGFLEG